MDAKKRAFPPTPPPPIRAKKPSQTKPARLRSCLSQTGAEKLWHRSRERKTFVLTSYVALHLAKAEKPAFYLVSRKLTSIGEMFPPPSPLYFLASVWGNFLSFFFPPQSTTHTLLQHEIIDRRLSGSFPLPLLNFHNRARFHFCDDRIKGERGKEEREGSRQKVLEGGEKGKRFRRLDLGVW